jgi:hypothetical protein
MLMVLLQYADDIEPIYSGGTHESWSSVVFQVSPSGPPVRKIQFAQLSVSGFKYQAEGRRVQLYFSSKDQ